MTSLINIINKDHLVLVINCSAFIGFESNIQGFFNKETTPNKYADLYFQNENFISLSVIGLYYLYNDKYIDNTDIELYICPNLTMENINKREFDRSSCRLIRKFSIDFRTLFKETCYELEDFSFKLVNDYYISVNYKGENYATLYLNQTYSVFPELEKYKWISTIQFM